MRVEAHTGAPFRLAHALERNRAAADSELLGQDFVVHPQQRVAAGEALAAKATDKTGPALTGMGAHHPAEYFAESILDPNAVIVTDVPDWTGPDGRSKMPSYNESLTLEQWVNLVAYLTSLTGGRR